MARVSVKVPLESLQQPAQPVVAQQAAAAPAPAKQSNKQWLVYGGVALLVIALLAVFINDRRHLKQEVTKLSTNQTTTTGAQDAAAKYGPEVANAVTVPTGITPIANTPSEADLTKLKADNPIYSNAQAGDVFMIYTQPDKTLFLVVYRPGTKKVVLATVGSTAAATNISNTK